MKFFLQAIFFISVCLNTEGQNTFQRIYGGSYGQFTNCIAQDNTGNFLISGNLNSISENSFLIKTNAFGDTLWTKTFFDTIYNINVINTLDGGIMFTSGHYNSGIIIMKMDSIGNLIWSKRIDGGIPEFQSSTQLSDSNFVIVGQVYDSISQNIFLIKFNSSGDTLWTKTYGGSGTNYGMSVKETTDKGLVIGGYTNRINNNTFDYCIIKTDSNGVEEWTKLFGDNNVNQVCFSVIQTFDRGYVLGGNTGIIKIDSSGNMIWQRNYSLPSDGTVFIQAADSGFIIGGTYYDNITEDGLLILKLDSIGNVQWCRGFDAGITSLGINNRYPLIQTIDQGFATGANWCNQGHDSSGVSLIKTDLNGNSICNQVNLQITSHPLALQQNNINTNTLWFPFSINSWPVQTGHLDGVLELCSSFTQSESFDDFTSDFSISPNPATDQIVIENSKNRIDLIQIYNLFGQQIFSSYLNPTEENFSINCENFSRGIYFVKSTFDSGSVVKKILIE